jgi:predicted SAM-dependent methyltransferase
MTNDPIKLNLGCGWQLLPGYVNIDNDPRKKPDLLHDVLTGIPYSDNSVDEVRAFDFLEHVATCDVIWLMEEIYRVLKPGGKLISFTPDAECGQGAFADPTHLSFWTEARWLYFSHPAYRNLYDIKAEFEIETLKRSLTDPIMRVYHLYVAAVALKEVASVS